MKYLLPISELPLTMCAGLFDPRDPSDSIAYLAAPLFDCEVLDGCTVRGTIHLPWGASLRDTVIAVDGVACWPLYGTTFESYSFWPAGREVAQAAADDLRTLVETSLELRAVWPRRDRDGLGRIIARLIARVRGGGCKWTDAAEWMRLRGHRRMSPEAHASAVFN